MTTATREAFSIILRLSVIRADKFSVTATVPHAASAARITYTAVIPPTDDILRSSFLDAAERQLASAVDDEISTRAVCEAVGATQPVLYRLFGDKRGLLDALARRGLERYAARKAKLETSSNPVDDLRVGWDDHMAFSQENPALYRLMFSPRPWTSSAARDGVLALLVRALERCAAAGVLTVEPRTAADMLLSANIGLAATWAVTPPEGRTDDVSSALREAIIGGITREHPGRTPTAEPVVDAARQLDAGLRIQGEGALLPEERELLQVWLRRLQGA